MRRHYIYYRVAQADLEPALEAARAGLAELRRERRDLQAQLLRRPEVRDGLVTLMEVHGIAGTGIDAALAAQIEACMTPRLAPWLRSPRHVEAFDLIAA